MIDQTIAHCEISSAFYITKRFDNFSVLSLQETKIKNKNSIRTHGLRGLRLLSTGYRNHSAIPLEYGRGALALVECLCLYSANSVLEYIQVAVIRSVDLQGPRPQE